MNRVLIITALYSLLTTLSATADNLMPIRWTADASKDVAAQIPIAQGETRDLVCTLRNYGSGITVPSNATASLLYQTNGMGRAYWAGGSASVTTGGVITATWTPSLDVGASAYSFVLGVQSGTNRIYTAYGIIRMRTSPGYVPNTLPLPPQILDFDSITVTHAPWATPADISAATNGLLNIERDPEAKPIAQAAYTAATNAVPSTRTVNGKALTSNITLTAANVGAISAESDSLASVTARGSTTEKAITIGERDAGIVGERSIAQGYNVVASGYGSMAHGDYAVAGGYAAYSSGFHTFATADFSRALGYLVVATNDYAFVWQGSPGGWDTPAEYGSHGPGTYSINPVGGTSGLWIGESSLASLLSSYATTNGVESIRGIYTDIATNVTYHVVVSNGNWLIIEQ